LGYGYQFANLESWATISSFFNLPKSSYINKKKERVKMRKIVNLFIIFLTITFLVGCSERIPPDTLIYGRGNDSVGLDPAHEEDGESFKVCESIYDTLVQYQADSTDIEPALAESWENSEDGLEWTFHLRKGVQFHDGTELNADAVVFSLERQHNKEHPFHDVGGGYIYWFDLGLNQTVDKIESIDKYTVKITLNRPFAPFLYAMTLVPFAIVSPTALKEDGENFSSNPVGTGPFKFVSWERDDKIILEANENYWGGKPSIKRVIFRVIPDNSARLMNLKKGMIHIMDMPNPDDVPDIRSDKNIRLLEETGINIGYVAMNLDKKPFDNLKVRLAINHAINKKSIVDNLYKGLGIVAKNPIPPTMWGYNDEIEDFEYNPELAKQLLKEAGFPEGFDTTLWVMPNPRPYFLTPDRIGVAIQADLKKVGINAKIEKREWGKYLEELRNGEHDIAMLGWSADYVDPDNFLYYLLDKDNAEKPAGNIAFYRSEELHKILIEAQTISDHEERTRLYKEAQKIIHEDAPWVCVAHAKQVVAVSKKVEDYKIHPVTWKHLWRTKLVNE